MTLGEAIRVLDRRLEWLESKPESGGGKAYVRAEIAALHMALPLMQLELVNRHKEAGRKAPS